MSVKIDESGRRSIYVETEVPGTPEEVWEAIASGQGVSAWFVPCKIEPGVGGKMTLEWAPGYESVSSITAWDSPRRFAVEGGAFGPAAPKLATEWTVEARAGGTCVVRVVNSLFTDSEDWDDQLTGLEGGWPGIFRVLGLYLRHFRGLPCSSFILMKMLPGPEAEVWRRLAGELGLEGAAPGEFRRAPAGGPELAGQVEFLGGAKQPHSLYLRLEAPAPGLASLGAYPAGAQARLGLLFFFYGDGAPAVAAEQQAVWEGWLKGFGEPKSGSC